jgi:hypothetical protein
VKEFSRIAVNAARSLEQPTRDTTAAASAQISSTYFPSTSSGFYSDRGVPHQDIMKILKES